LATKIRLKRIGRRNRPFYRLVIMDARNRRDGAAIEEVGWYNPIAKDEMYSLKEDRILHWLQEGAQPTDTAHDILRTAGLAHKWHLMKQGLDEAAVEKEMKKWALERDDVLERRRQRAEAKVADKKAAAADTATEVDDKSVPATAEAAVDEAPADVEKSADDGTDAAAKAPAEKADDGETEEPTEKEDTAAEETEAEDESAETAVEDGADEQVEDSAAEDKEVQEEQEEDKSTDEVEPKKDKSGKKGSKKIAKKNGQETDDK